MRHRETIAQWGVVFGLCLIMYVRYEYRIQIEKERIGIKAVVLTSLEKKVREMGHGRTRKLSRTKVVAWGEFEERRSYR